MRPPRLPLALTLLALLGLSCGDGGRGAAGAEAAGGGAPWPARNLLANPGFEAGREGWSIREDSPHWGDFAVAEAPVHAGRRSARLRLEQAAHMPPRAAAVYGVVQEIREHPLPDLVGGHYRVEQWQKSSPETDLYLQVVAIVWGGSKPAGAEKHMPNFQLRSYLAGLDEHAFRLRNAKIHFVEKGPPRMGEWVRFEVPLRQELEARWGAFADDYDRISILFEARWDNMPGRNEVRADVYYDDLFVGYRDPGTSR